MTVLAARVVETLTVRGLSLATAESLTGGLIGATITAVPGASAVYVGGVVAYQTRLKEDLLEVPAATIATHTVVSEPVARAMAVGLSRSTGADWCLAVTGVAGPTGQDGHEPGEVWIGVVGPTIGTHPPVELMERYDLTGDRSAVREQTVDASFRVLLRALSPV
ncbi:MAG: CinA family protein [Propioniciclava sp.]